MYGLTLNACVYCAFRYLLYEVNPGEGFNLRRDVYIRIANLVKALNVEERWTLVLPPWNRLYHWRSTVKQSQIPWSTFFDLKSLERHVPVMEFSEFLNGQYDCFRYCVLD